MKDHNQTGCEKQPSYFTHISKMFFVKDIELQYRKQLGFGLGMIPDRGLKLGNW